MRCLFSTLLISESPIDAVSRLKQRSIPAAKRWSRVSLISLRWMFTLQKIFAWQSSVDEKLDRTTNGTGPVSGLTMDEISRLDAGYKYTADGVTYPFRGKGINIHPLEDFFKAFPNQRFYVEIKTEDLRAVPVVVD